MTEERRIIFQLKVISDKIHHTGDAAFAKYGLTSSQARYLQYLAEAGGSLSQKDLEIRADVSHPTVVGIVARLTEKGFVTVRPDTKDRRRKIVSLTDPARDVYLQLCEGSEHLNRDLFRKLTPDERRELSRLLGIIMEDLHSQDFGAGTPSDP